VRAAVRDVSFEMQPGMALGIIGESGAGKTSLALALMGLHDPDRVVLSGDIKFKGTNLLELSENQRRRVRGSGMGMIFQDSSGGLDPSMRVVDQVAEALRIHRGAGRREAVQMAFERLARVGVPGEILSVAPYAYQLSGGLCQRAMIAAALACDPDLLIADEPTSALDVTLQAQIIALLNERRAETRLGVIFISHDLALVSSFADEIIVLHGGEVVEHGSCLEVLRSPKHEYTRNLIAAWNYEDVQGGAKIAAS